MPLPDAAPLPPVPDPEAQLVATTQRELARLGLYSGAIDGIAGSRTRAAISRYQAAAGLTVTGEPSPALLGLLTAPTPPTRSLALGPGALTAPDTRTADIAAPERVNTVDLQRDRYRRVQAALNKIGYGPLSVDGQAGPATGDAIRRFEFDNGLEISGIANERVLDRLVAIGARDPV